MVDLVEKILEVFERCNSDDFPEDLACLHCIYSGNGCYHSLHQDLIDAVKNLLIHYRFLSNIFSKSNLHASCSGSLPDLSAEEVDYIKNLIGG